jgi:hypothetical protein
VAALLCFAAVLSGCADVEPPPDLPAVWRDLNTESIYLELSPDGTGRVHDFPAPTTPSECARLAAPVKTTSITWELTGRGKLRLVGDDIDATITAGERFGVAWSELYVTHCVTAAGKPWTEEFYETRAFPLG